MTKLLIIYHSRTGGTRQMARHAGLEATCKGHGRPEWEERREDEKATDALGEIANSFALLDSREPVVRPRTAQCEADGLRGGEGR